MVWRDGSVRIEGKSLSDGIKLLCLPGVSAGAQEMVWRFCAFGALLAKECRLLIPPLYMPPCALQPLVPPLLLATRAGRRALVAPLRYCALARAVLVGSGRLGGTCTATHYTQERCSNTNAGEYRHYYPPRPAYSNQVRG